MLSLSIFQAKLSHQLPCCLIADVNAFLAKLLCHNNTTYTTISLFVDLKYALLYLSILIRPNALLFVELQAGGIQVTGLENVSLLAGRKLAP